MSLTDSLGLGGIFGSQASQGTIQNLPAQPGQSMWVTTTSNTSGLPYSNTTYGLIEENNKLLVEVRDELLDMKKWLIATYPDVYKQYVCVKQLEEASK